MIHIFKTSVKTDRDVVKLKPGINNLASDIKWNFDLEDCDNILRIDSSKISPKMVIKLLKESKFECQELE
jgi:hypothetical protein